MARIPNTLHLYRQWYLASVTRGYTYESVDYKGNYIGLDATKACLVLTKTPEDAVWDSHWDYAYSGNMLVLVFALFVSLSATELLAVSLGWMEMCGTFPLGMITLRSVIPC